MAGNRYKRRKKYKMRADAASLPIRDAIKDWKIGEVRAVLIEGMRVPIYAERHQELGVIIHTRAIRFNQFASALVTEVVERDNYEPSGRQSENCGDCDSGE